MKIEELSNGNYVRTKDLFYAQIKMIKEDKVLITDECGLEKLVKLEELMPIPITVELLQKYGFIYWGGTMNIAAKMIKGYGVMLSPIHNDWKDWELSVGLNDVRDKHWSIIKYFHQLQNILMSCGIELNLQIKK